MDDLQTSLAFCTHIVYGHVGIRNGTFDVVTLDKRQLPIFQKVKDLKKKNRNVKFLLSLGGKMDRYRSEKYLQLLEAGTVKQQRFIESALKYVQDYQFDGLDLSYRLPTDKSIKKQSKAIKALKSAGKTAADKIKSNLGLDKKEKLKSIGNHKDQMTQLISEMKRAFSAKKLILTLTVMPNVNASSKYLLHRKVNFFEKF